MVLTNNNYTKHYYIEGERVSTKIGGGFQYAPTPYATPITPLLNGSSYATIAAQLLARIRTDAVDAGYDSVAAPAAFRCMATLGTSNNLETEKYYYHSDHLGSSSFITNKNGLASQHFLYMPYGEQFVEQKITSTYYTPYKFSGKEKDAETSYSYFGARYYDSDLSIFLSIDRFADKYPNLNPYHYCAWNPVKNIDINGDSTLYYYKGQLLFASHDGLRNAVVDVSAYDLNSDQISYIKSAADSKDPKYHSDKLNKQLRSLGVSYHTDEYEKFYSDNRNYKNSEGVYPEHATYGRYNAKTKSVELTNVHIIATGKGQEGRVVDYEKDPDVNNNGNPSPYTSMPDGTTQIHTHTATDTNPSSADSSPGDTDNKLFYDVMINETTIFMYNRKGSGIIVLPKSNTYGSH